MEKFKNIDILEALDAIVEKNTLYYKGDYFDIDRKRILQYAHSDNKEDKTLVFLSRQCGTYLFRERDLLLTATPSNIILLHYQGSPDIRAYIVELNETKPNEEKIEGNLYAISNYDEYCLEMLRSSLTIQSVDVTFENGSQETYCYDDFNIRAQFICQMNGNVESIRYMPEDENELDCVLLDCRAKRKAAKTGSFRKHLKALSDTLSQD